MHLQKGAISDKTSKLPLSWLQKWHLIKNKVVKLWKKLFVNVWKTLVWSELDEKAKQMPEAMLLELLTQAASAFLIPKLFSFVFTRSYCLLKDLLGHSARWLFGGFCQNYSPLPAFTCTETNHSYLVVEARCAMIFRWILAFLHFVNKNVGFECTYKQTKDVTF